jgi:hypothetical protein
MPKPKLSSIVYRYLIGTALFACAITLFNVHAYCEAGVTAGCAIALLGSILRSQL